MNCKKQNCRFIAAVLITELTGLILKIVVQTKTEYRTTKIVQKQQKNIQNTPKKHRSFRTTHS